MPLVTVLMPVHNGEKYLREAVDSILSQGFRDFEFLAVDDGSTDRSLEILKSYEGPRFRVVRHRKNRGLIRTLNESFASIRTKYVARMDCDDAALPGRLQRQVDFMEKNPGISVLGGAMVVVRGGHARMSRFPIEHDDILAHCFFESAVSHPTTFLRRKSLDGFKPLFHADFVAAEDYDLWSRMLRKGLRFHNLPHPLLRYRAHEAGERPVFRANQIASADRVRREWLAWMGITPTSREMDMQRAAGRAEWPKDGRFLGALETWLTGLIDRNRSARLIEPRAFYRAVCGRWMAALRQVPGAGPGRLSRYWESRLKPVHPAFDPRVWHLHALGAASLLKGQPHD